MQPTQLPLPKWLAIGLSLSPLFIFIVTMTIAIRIVQRRDNTIIFTSPYGEESFTLYENIFDNDISAYGISTPEYYMFSCGFTLLSLALSIEMGIRYTLFRWCAARTASNCCFPFGNGFVLGVGLLHSPALLVMAWSNGKQDQRIHFPAALVGLGLLYIYGVLSIPLLDLQMLWMDRVASTTPTATPNVVILSGRQHSCFLAEVILGCTMAVLFPLCIYRWIIVERAVYEWWALLSSCLHPMLEPYTFLKTLYTFLNWHCKTCDFVCYLSETSCESHVI